MFWIRVLGGWLGIAALMVLHGAARERFVTPALGDLRAHQLSSVTGALIVIAASYVMLPWLGGVGAVGAQVKIGLAWLALTVAFEFVFGHWVAGHSWEKLLRDYNLAAGRLWILVLAATAVGPWIAGRLRG